MTPHGHAHRQRETIQPQRLEWIPRAERSSAEYLWLTGSAQYLRKQYALAEPPLRALLETADADDRQRIYGANALVGVYRRLDRPADALWAAFWSRSSDTAGERFLNELREAHLFGQNMDAAYMLDVELTDEDLRRHLEQYGAATRAVPDSPGRWSPSSLVRYALAVRHARREEYGEAAAIYEDLQAWPRARRMRQAARLHNQTRDPQASGERLLQARYDYASFLADNSTRIFFNDSIWRGLQDAVLLPPQDGSSSRSGRFVAAAIDDTERAALLRIERTLRDQQEEYWRAYQILNAVVDQAGRSAIGRQAARKAIVSLRRINTSRFGRASEIQKADTRLTNWLAAAR